MDEAGTRAAAGDDVSPAILLDAVWDYAIYRLDPAGHVASWSFGAQRLKGFTAPEILGSPYARFFEPEAQARGEPAALLHAALKEGRITTQGWRLRRDGSRFWADAAISAIRDSEGRHLGFAKVTRDLTETRQQQEALRASEERFRTAMYYSPNGLALVGLDGRWLQVNRAVCELLGYSAEELQGTTFQALTHPDDLEADLEQVAALLLGRIDSYRMEKRYLRRDGSEVWGLLGVSLVRDAEGHPQYFIAQIQDIGPLKQTEAALHAERDRLHVTLCSIGDGVVTTDAAARITFLNPAAEAMTGWSQAEALGQPIEAVFGLLEAETGLAIRNPLRMALEERRTIHRQTPALMLARQGRRVDVQDSAAPIRDKDGAVIGAVMVLQDVSSLRRMQRELEFSALHDSLTGLPNRHRLSTVLSGLEGGGEHTLCFLDLDRFKLINDTAGHAAGDTLLRRVARQLQRGVRGTDLVARLGGDEFAILLFDCPVHLALPLLRDVLDNVAATPFVWEGRSYALSASARVVPVTAGAQEQGTVMKHADVACYAAKHAGRNRISVYAEESDEGGARHREILMVSEIREALEDGRFVLYAQAIAAIGTGRVSHHEVLLRMVGRNGALIPPDHFIPVAERYDLMAELDRWVLAEVLRRRADALTQGEGMPVAVNLSAQSLNDPGFLTFFLDLAEASPLPLGMLTLEITETALVSSLDSARAVIERIRALGCQIALDDFGAGLSSFAYLRSFPVDCIKIDGSLIRGMTESTVNLAIVRAIAGLAREIGAATVAEFVEDAALLERLRELGVEGAQGYGVAMPEPLEALLARRQEAGQDGGRNRGPAQGGGAAYSGEPVANLA